MCGCINCCPRSFVKELLLLHSFTCWFSAHSTQSQDTSERKARWRVREREKESENPSLRIYTVIPFEQSWSLLWMHGSIRLHDTAVTSLSRISTEAYRTALLAEVCAWVWTEVSFNPMLFHVWGDTSLSAYTQVSCAYTTCWLIIWQWHWNSGEAGRHNLNLLARHSQDGKMTEKNFYMFH